MKFPDKMLQMLKCLYRENISCVKVNKSFTKPFKVSTGLRQGCVLSPILFNLFVNDLPASTHEENPILRTVNAAYVHINCMSVNI